MTDTSSRDRQRNDAMSTRMLRTNELAHKAAQDGGHKFYRLSADKHMAGIRHNRMESPHLDRGVYVLTCMNCGREVHETGAGSALDNHCS